MTDMENIRTQIIIDCRNKIYRISSHTEEGPIENSTIYSKASSINKFNYRTEITQSKHLMFNYIYK
jgi:hypothetical protein